MQRSIARRMPPIPSRWIGRLLRLHSLLLVLASASQSQAQELVIAQRWSLPLLEISGLDLYEKTLYLASDHSRGLLKIPLERDAIESLQLAKAKTLKLKALSGHKLGKTSQWEALAIDKAGSIFALKESTDQIFQFTNDGKALRVYQLLPWEGRTHKNKGYEGLLLLKRSHMLLALSKPPVLVEFGPKGDAPLGIDRTTLLAPDETFAAASSDSLVALAHWALDSPGICELSDLALNRESQALALLKDCPLIVRIPDLKASKNVFTPGSSWLYPSELHHAEGLLAAPANGFVIAVDQKSEKPNLFRLEAKSEASKP